MTAHNMKIILDITHTGDGNMTRHIMPSLPVTIGRGFDNDIILDDPFVDPHHARIDMDAATGNIVLRDLSSKNGITQGHRTLQELALSSGDSFALGLSEIRFHTPAQSMAAALPLERLPPWQRHIRQPMIAWPLYFLAIAAVTGWAYLNIWSEETAAALSNAAVMAGSAILSWAAVWALVGRLVRRRAQFAAHVGVASFYTLVSVIVWTVQSYVNFITNENRIADAIDYAASFAVMFGLLTAALSLSSTMLLRRRRIHAGITAAGILAGSLAFSLISAKSFDTVPHYATGIEPRLAFLAPAVTPAKMQETNKNLFKSKVFSQKQAENP